MLNVAEMTPAGGGGGTPLPSNIVTGTSQAYNIAYWQNSSSIEGYGAFTYSPGSGVSLSGDIGMSGNLGVGNGLTVSGGTTRIHGLQGIVTAQGGVISSSASLPALGLDETTWATNGATIGTIGSSSSTNSLNGVTGTLGGTLNLPPSGAFNGQMFIVKDEGGNALSANILLAGNGNTIDGASDVVINENYGVVRVYWNGSAWFTF